MVRFTLPARSRPITLITSESERRLKTIFLFQNHCSTGCRDKHCSLKDFCCFRVHVNNSVRPKTGTILLETLKRFDPSLLHLYCERRSPLRLPRTETLRRTSRQNPGSSQ